MQQQPTNPVTSMPPVPPSNISTEQIQKYLDENKQLILAILENQNIGKLAECAQYQALLQKNLLFLAAIADAQPQAASARPQMMPQAGVQPSGHFVQQAPIFPPRPPFNPQQVQELQLQQQQHQQHAAPFMGGPMGMRPGIMNGIHAEPFHGGSSDLPPGPNMSEFRRSGIPNNLVDGRGNKQDAGNAVLMTAAGDGHRGSATEHGSGDAEPTYPKRPEDAKTP